MDELTEKEYVDWLQTHTTRKVFRKLEEKIKEIEENMGTGGTINRSDANETLANSCWEAGKIEGIREIFNMDVWK